MTPDDEFENWLILVRESLIENGLLSETQAIDYTKDKLAWRVFFDDDYSPKEAVFEDMTYWGD
jgi:hypothetical protein